MTLVPAIRAALTPVTPVIRAATKVVRIRETPAIKAALTPVIREIPVTQAIPIPVIRAPVIPVLRL